MAFSSPGQFVVGAIQELQWNVMKDYIQKMGAMFNSLVTLVIKLA